MTRTNLERMIMLAERTFDARHDIDQLNVDEQIINHLLKIHPASVSEYNDAKGPVAWVLLIPTTSQLMHQFVDEAISESELYNLTPVKSVYDSIYLCSAMVLEEYRRKGIAKQLILSAIEQIRNDHPIRFLFSWAFSKEGDAGAELISKLTGLPLIKRVAKFS